MPYITEEIYHKYYFNKEIKGKNLNSIHLTKWPTYSLFKQDKKKEKVFDIFCEILTKVRQEKSRAQKSMKTPINLSLNSEQYHLLGNVLNDLMGVCGAKKIKKAGVMNIELLVNEDKKQKEEKDQEKNDSNLKLKINK